MKILLATVALSILPIAASAQDMPKFMKDAVPEASAAPAWQEYMAVMNPNGALDDKTKQLIALGQQDEVNQAGEGYSPLATEQRLSRALRSFPRRAS